MRTPPRSSRSCEFAEVGVAEMGRVLGAAPGSGKVRTLVVQPGENAFGDERCEGASWPRGVAGWAR